MARRKYSNHKFYSIAPPPQIMEWEADALFVFIRQQLAPLLFSQRHSGQDSRRTQYFKPDKVFVECYAEEDYNLPRNK